MRTWRGTIVVAYLKDPDRILLIENAGSGKITCPGGAVEESETSVAAAVRELEEEVGWKIDGQMLINSGIKHEFTYGQNKPERAGDSACNEIFLLNAEGLPDPADTADAKNAKWFPLAEGLSRMSFKDVTPLLEKAVALVNLK